MLTVKKMLGDGLEDTHPNASYSLIPLAQGESVSFAKGRDHLGNECQQMSIERRDGPSEVHDLAGNVYILSDSGKTIASHGS